MTAGAKDMKLDSNLLGSQAIDRHNEGLERMKALGLETVDKKHDLNSNDSKAHRKVLSNDSTGCGAARFIDLLRF